LSRVVLSFSSIACLALALGVRAQVPAQTPQQVAASLHGDAVVVARVAHSGTGVRAGRASTVLDLPLETVMGVVTDYARYKDFLPHFTQSRVLAKRGATANVYIEAQLLGGAAVVWAEIHIEEAASVGATRVVTSRVTHTNTRRLDARWEITPITATRTLVTFELLVEPDLPFPDDMMSNENEVATRDSVRNLRAHVAGLH